MRKVVNHVIVKGALIEELYSVLEDLSVDKIPDSEMRKDKAIVCALIYLLQQPPVDYNSYVESANLHDRS